MQERTYCEILDRREIAGDAANRTNKLDLTNVFCDDEGRLPLEDAKRLVLKNMRILEVAGYTSSKDGCSSIINDLAKDILDQRNHRLQRRAELSKASKVKAGLQTKQEYMESQLEQYKMYISHCLNNLNKAGNNKRVHFSTLYDGKDDQQNNKAHKLRSKAALKYPATKLHEKGVLQRIEGLPDNHLKNVQFVFLPLEQSGMFEISARFVSSLL